MEAEQDTVKYINIAIDGLAGAGKSTLAQSLAKELVFLYFNTGSVYRALTAECLAKKVDINNGRAVYEALKNTIIDVIYKNGVPVVCINGKRIDEKLLRSENISNATAIVAQIPEIRSKVRHVQHNIAANNNVVMEGRDIGTVVLPNADMKFFVQATVKSRADRRFADLPINEQSQECYDNIFKGIKQRDEYDKNRAVCPTKPAVGSINIDTSDNTPEQTLEIVANRVRSTLHLQTSTIKSSPLTA